jgi:MbtH protein
MSNPFDNQEALYLTLVNTKGQYSIWPTFLAVPKGWQTVFGPLPRAEILARIDMEWIQTGASAACGASACGS